MGPRPVSGAAMLVVTVLLVATMLTLAVLAGPFGRTPRVKQEAIRHWPASQRQ